MFNEREKLILQVLLKNNEQLSIKEIAKATKIKERTLYREIKNLESSLQALDIDLIKEKSKYYLSGNIESLDSTQFETNFEDYAYSAETRLNLILCFIILNEDTSIKDISEKLMLSYNTVASIVPTIEKILEDYKLSLVRKKGQGIEIVGKEIDRRILLISLLCNEISDEEFFTRLNGRESLSSNPFMKFLNFDLLTQIFYNNKNLEIFLRLSYETESKEKYTQDEYRYIIDLLEATKKSVEFDITDSIINFLIKILKTCRLIEQLSYFNDKYSYTLVYKINLLIKYVSEKMNVDFTQDTNLSGGLIAHVESAIKRYQMKLTEENDELQEFVLKNYNELYLIIKSELLVVFDEINFNSTELSYIVIHFASSYEQIYRKNFVRALVICASGIGSSKILGSQIRKNIPEIKNLEYTIPSKVNSNFVKNYDVVISTIELDNDIDYILIPTILKEKDVEIVRKKILESRSFKRKNSVDFDKAINVEELMRASKEILDNIRYIEIDNSSDERLTLRNVFDESGLEIKNKDEIVESLIERHEKSSVVIPGTNLALFHTLNDTIDQPFIIISNHNNPSKMVNVIGEEEEVTVFFTMVSPDNQSYTELLGQISIAILNDEVLNSALHSKNSDFIVTKIDLILKDYILQL